MRENWNTRAQKLFLFDRQAHRNCFRHKAEKPGQSDLRHESNSYLEQRAEQTEGYKDEMIKGMVKTMGHFQLGPGRRSQEKLE